MLSSRKNTAPSRPRYTIHGSGVQKSNVPMARKQDIPAGTYGAKILSITPTTTAAGAEAIQVIYKLTNVRGQTLLMREVIPTNSFPYRRFCDALIAAGVEEGSDILDAVGVEERITITYPDPHGLGHISKRVPLNRASANEDEAESTEAARYAADEEFDDFLADEEEM